MSLGYINNSNKEEYEHLEIQTILSICDKVLETLKREADADNTCQKLIELIREGCPMPKEDLPIELKQYRYFRDELSINSNGIILIIKALKFSYLKN